MRADPPQTAEGQALWRAIDTCAGQVLATDGAVYAWNFTAVLQVGALLGAPTEALAELLQPIERLILFAHMPET